MNLKTNNFPGHIWGEKIDQKLRRRRIDAETRDVKHAAEITLTSTSSLNISDTSPGPTAALPLLTPITTIDLKAQIQHCSVFTNRVGAAATGLLLEWPPSWFNGCRAQAGAIDRRTIRGQDKAIETRITLSNGHLQQPEDTLTLRRRDTWRTGDTRGGVDG